VKLLRTLRLDPSDTLIFLSAASPGEWAIPGTFAFTDGNPEALQGKALAAFRGGFLGLPSLGWSTLAQIVTADENDRDAAIELLAQCMREHFGAPDKATAREAAVAEIDFAISLCDHPPGTVIALHRTSEAGSIRERFRRLDRSAVRSCEAFSFGVETPEVPAEEIDLAALARDGEA
jgi:hypothetical protein